MQTPTTFFIILGLFLQFFTVVPVFSGMGDSICAPYKPLVVQIRTEFSNGDTKSGFGFIVGEHHTGTQGSFFYIATANHVVRRNRPEDSEAKIWLRFFWDLGGAAKEAELMGIMDMELDLAFLRIKKKDIYNVGTFSWKGQGWCNRLQREESVWFIGRAGQWYVPPDRREGIMLGPEKNPKGVFRIDCSKIQVGTSGAPLILQDGIVGMVVKDLGDEALAVGIDEIRRTLTGAGPYPWNLVECGGDSGPGPEPDPRPSPQAGKIMTDPATGMELVWIPQGCFQMGSPESEKDRDTDEGPVHQVCVDGFWLGKYEVTQGQWQKIMGENPAYFKKGATYPVEQVSWEDTQKFLGKLNKQEARVIVYPLRRNGSMRPGQVRAQQGIGEIIYPVIRPCMKIIVQAIEIVVLILFVRRA
ncbi:MAG: hypothetical protein D3923_05055 [Candidatus Electrothrix sp. AR3]|nr:hypothetical protein [Candidatus Electrothrix sp. AR3]